MSATVRWLGLTAAKWVLSFIANGVLLLVAWQVIVTGPRDLVVVSAAGLVASIGLIVAHELGHAVVGWVVGLPPVSLTLVFVRVEWEGRRLILRRNTQLFRHTGFVA